MVNCLRQELLYSEKRPRDVLFGVIARLVTAPRRERLIVARLTRQAARTAAADAGFEYANWNMAAKAVVKAMLCSGAMLDEAGAPIAFDVKANAAVVGALSADHVDRTETYLLEFLLRRLGDVTLRDHTPLAHALFRQFDRSVCLHDLEDRVAILAARLAGRIELIGDTYVACDLPGARPVDAPPAVPPFRN
jgi:hypothetical protein